MRLDHPLGIRYRVNGIDRPDLIADLREVAGPNLYATGGFSVDLSSDFSELVAVRILRAFVEATGARDDRVYEVHEEGADVIPDRRFRIQSFRTPTAATSTDADVLRATGAVANQKCIDASSLTGSCIVGCDQDHPNGAVDRANMIQGSGAGKVTAVTGLVTPTAALAEVGAVNLSGITVQFEAIGVPA